MTQWCLRLAMFGLASASLRAQESLPLEAVAAVKNATVMVITTAHADSARAASGSGFLIRVDGETGYVATNQHVIRPPGSSSGGALNITVVFRSGTRDEQKLPGQVVASLAAPDLAIIKSSGVRNPPAPLDVLRETEPVETMPVHSG